MIQLKFDHISLFLIHALRLIINELLRARAEFFHIKFQDLGLYKKKSECYNKKLCKIQDFFKCST